MSTRVAESAANMMPRNNSENTGRTELLTSLDHHSRTNHCQNCKVHEHKLDNVDTEVPIFDWHIANIYCQHTAPDTHTRLVMSRLLDWSSYSVVCRMHCCNPAAAIHCRTGRDSVPHTGRDRCSRRRRHKIAQNSLIQTTQHHRGMCRGRCSYRGQNSPTAGRS